MLRPDMRFACMVSAKNAVRKARALAVPIEENGSDHDCGNRARHAGSSLQEVAMSKKKMGVCTGAKPSPASRSLQNGLDK
jgi:hypothetical protein